MNPFKVGLQKGHQLLPQKTPDSNLTPSPGPCRYHQLGIWDAWGMERVLADPWDTAGAVAREQVPARLFIYQAYDLGQG